MEILIGVAMAYCILAQYGTIAMGADGPGMHMIHMHFPTLYKNVEFCALNAVENHHYSFLLD